MRIKPRRIPIAIVGAIIAGTALTGCSAPENPEVMLPTPTAFESAAGPSVDGTPTGTRDTNSTGAERKVTVARFFNAFGTSDWRTLAEWSAPGSPANEYAAYWREAVSAGRTSGDPPQVTTSEEAATLKYLDGSEYTFRDLEFNANNKLATWSNSAGHQLQDRLIDKSAKARIGALEASVQHQYENANGDLKVTATLKNKGDEAVFVTRSSYRNPDGKKRTMSVGAAAATGVVKVPAGRSRAVVVTVLNGKPGGRLALLTYNEADEELGKASIRLPGKQ